MVNENPQDLPLPPWPETGQNLTALIDAQREVARLSAREQLFNALLVSVNAVLWAFDWETRRVLYVSPAYERLFGRPAGLLLADVQQWRDSVYPDDLEHAERSLAQVLEKGAVEDREYRIITADGQVRWLRDKCFLNRQAEPGQPVMVVGIAEDITDRKRLETELQHLATTDVLTRSSNRRHFFECASREFQQARQQGSSLAFLLLDIDDFKRINDSYGHQLGDLVLQQLAECGRTALRRADLFGRIGGEEFSAVFPGCTPEMARHVAERLQREIQRLSFNHHGQAFGITVSLGLALLSADDESLDTLYSRADAAMYEAKRQGKNRIVSS
ncbi:sensor domain-containing diguanylate cyclase [Pseudomonas sp. Irchel s3h17]|uniref:GGDEF domain-containing protein n=1 Tax=Pseudomonas sp. Irchel s3h17 TaxID=2009182 RepID=UPI000BA4B6D8|nr:sensor domain-containing diguanylate cyclase [Pseudomonas sp. Irchel s3h17]